MNCEYCGESLEDALNPTKVVQGTFEEGDVSGSYFRYYCGDTCLTEDLAL